MSYFNTNTYTNTFVDGSYNDTSYNEFQPIYIDGTDQSVPISGLKYYNSIFGNVMASLVVDGGDSVLGGNVIISKHLNLGGSLNLLNASGNTIISSSNLSYLSGSTSNLQTQINTLSSTSILPLNNTFTGSNFFGGNVSLNPTSSVLFPTTTSTTTYANCASTGDTIRLIDGSNNVVSVGNASPNTSYRIITLKNASTSIFYILIHQTAGVNGVYLNAYNASTNTTNYGYTEITINSILYVIWNCPITLNNNSFTLYMYGLDNGGTPYLPTTQYAKVVITSSSTSITTNNLTYLSGATSNLQTQINSLGGGSTLLPLNNTWTGNTNTFNGNIITNRDMTINGNLTILPYTNVPDGLKVYSINCNSIIVSGQTVFAGAGLQTTALNATGSSTLQGVSATSISTTGVLNMNQSNIFLNTTGDTNNRIYYSGTISGPIINGYTSIKLLTVASSAYALLNSAGLYINSGLQATGSTILAGLTAGATSLSTLTASSTISQTPSGMVMGYYVKTGCSATETYTFTSTGLYMICFSINSDNLTTGSWWIDVLNNVNGGSTLATIRAPYYTTMNCSVNTSTNVITLTTTYSGAKLMIHKMFNY